MLHIIEWDASVTFMDALVRTMRELGFALRAARRETGMTQLELAQRSGVSRRWLSAVENGKRSNVDSAAVFKVLEALGRAIAVRPDPLAGQVSVFDLPWDENEQQ